MSAKIIPFKRPKLKFSETKCAFCQQEIPVGTETLVAEDGRAICPKCLVICAERLEEEE